MSAVDLPKIKLPDLESIYQPKLTLNKFVVAALDKYPKLKLQKIENFWKGKNFKASKDAVKEKPEKSATERISGLPRQGTAECITGFVLSTAQR